MKEGKKLKKSKLKKNKPFIIAVSGFTGAGKSFVANVISKKIDCVVLRSDVIRKEISGINLNQHVYEDFEKGIYSKEMTEKVYNEMFKRTKRYLRESKNVILDASFLDKNKRDKLREVSKELNVKLLILWVETPPDLIKERLSKRKGDVSDGRWEIYLKQKEKYEKPDEKDIVFIESVNKKELEKILDDIILRFLST
ncbi:MAG: AAA family ATPase [candidate division WOR-3 bacterium]